MGDPPLLGVSELNDMPGIRVTSSQAARAEQVVWGWVRPVLGVDERPADPSPELKAAVLELAVLFLKSAGGMTVAQDRRRADILQTLGQAVTAAAGRSTGPIGDFPAPCPDPIEDILGGRCGGRFR